MLTLLAVLGVLAIFFVAAAVATREGEVLLDAPADAADLRLPSGPLQPEDVASVRFGLALRGYRMSEVDEVLDRVQAELAERDARILELEGRADDGSGPGADEGYDETPSRATSGVAAPSAALLAPVLATQQTVPAPLDEQRSAVVTSGAGAATDGPVNEAAGDGADDDETGWAFDDGGAARSAARLTPADGAGAGGDDDWGMPQVLDLEPASPDLEDAVETPDPVSPPAPVAAPVPAVPVGEDLVHDAEPVDPVAPTQDDLSTAPAAPAAPTAPTAPAAPAAPAEVPAPADAPVPGAPAWSGSATTPPDDLPPHTTPEVAPTRPGPDPFAPDEPFRPAEPLRPVEPLSPLEPLTPPAPFPTPAPGPVPDPATGGPDPYALPEPHDLGAPSERPAGGDAGEQAGPSYP